ncbi:MAG: bis(5'-nucleosyl)-tetraphosphatase [Candidatus Micrarchaeota archaeon]
MIEEKSCGLILFREINKMRLYLLLNYEEGHWGFPKGHVEKNEDEIETALRETMEETGITEITILPNFHESLVYQYRKNGQKFHKTVYFFIGKTKTERILLSHEHVGSMWLSYQMARKKLTFDNTKTILDAADNFLSNLVGNK